MAQSPNKRNAENHFYFLYFHFNLFILCDHHFSQQGQSYDTLQIELTQMTHLLSASSSQTEYYRPDTSQRSGFLAVF